MATFKPLVWDDLGEKKYEIGTSKGVYYPQASDGTYPKGYAWNGLTSVQESSDGGDENAMWADNIKYASIRAAEDFGFTIEAYAYPKEFAQSDGSEEVTMGVFIGQQKRVPFGFCYRTEIGSDTMDWADNAGYKLHLVYNATASPSERSYETANDSPDGITMSWECDTVPVPVTGYKNTAILTIDSTKCDKAKLADLEKILYGSDEADARLPLPDEVISIMRVLVTG